MTFFKRVILKGDGSLDAPFSRIWKRLAVFWHPHMSCYLTELIDDNEDIQEVSSSVQKGQEQPNE